LTLRLKLFLATHLLLSLLIAETYNVYPKQYWFTKGLFWLVLFSCLTAYGLCSRQYFTTIEWMIYKVIFFLPFLFLLFLFVPFIGIGFGLIFYVKFRGDNKFILYSDNKIRIEQPYIRFMGPDPQPILYVKDQFTSFQDITLQYSYHEETDMIEVKKRIDSSYMIILKWPNNWRIPDGVDTFFYKLRRKDQH
jgi:hypothetical protein